MPSLFLPRKSHPYDQKPTYPAVFDRGYIEETGLVGAWILNEMHPRDLSGYGNHAERVGASPKLSATPHGEAYHFATGTNNHRLNLGSISGDNPLSLSGSNTATICARIHPNSLTSSFPRIIDKSDGGNGANGWSLSLDDRSGNLELIFLKESSSASSTTNFYTHGEWISVGVTFDAFLANEVEFFANGVSDSTASHLSANSFEATTTGAAIGQWNHSTTDRHFNGPIDYVYVFRRVLPDAELARIYAEPYRYLQAVTKHYYLLPASVAGGPSFQPALAANSTVTITA